MTNLYVRVLIGFFEGAIIFPIGYFMGKRVGSIGTVKFLMRECPEEMRSIIRKISGIEDENDQRQENKDE